MIATRRHDRRVTPRARKRSASEAIAFPRFDCYGDAILEWHSAIDSAVSDPATARQISASVSASMERAIRQVERVGSARHRNLATFIRHALVALNDAEWDGARYILLTAFAALSAGAVSEGPSGILLQFPAPAAKTGIVTG
jgi:hypothetical protein